MANFQPLSNLLLAFTVFAAATASGMEFHSDYARSERGNTDVHFNYGSHGYLHGGADFVYPLDQVRNVGLYANFVREDSHDDTFPSAGAFLVHKLPREMKAELYTFGYIPVEDQYAVGIGLRLEKDYRLDDRHSLSAFIQPAFAHVKAVEMADPLDPAPVHQDHTMLLAGIGLSCRDTFSARLFGSQSFFRRNPDTMLTHVDLQEMTRIIAYENNDGFPDNSAGMDLSIFRLKPLVLTVRYAAMFFDGDTRHSAVFIPSCTVGKVGLSAGYQLIRGENKNDIALFGVSFAF